MRVLTTIARDEGAKNQDRIKSIETLCKITGDFIIKHEVGDSTQDALRQEVRQAAIDFFNSQGGNIQALPECQGEVLDIEVYNTLDNMDKDFKDLEEVRS
jgi:hypothetical protein